MEEGDESQRELSDGTNRATHHVQQFQHSDSICRCDIPSSSFSWPCVPLMMLIESVMDRE